jgi:hypothetical protein
MSFTGIVKNGQISLPPNAVLPEGATVVVEVREEAPLAEFAAELLKLAKDRAWPEDMALNHDHYLYGSPKR